MIKPRFSVVATLLVALPLLVLVPGCGGGGDGVSTPTSTPRPTSTLSPSSTATPIRTGTAAPTATLVPQGDNYATFATQSTGGATFGATNFVVNKITVTGNTKGFEIICTDASGRKFDFSGYYAKGGAIKQGTVFSPTNASGSSPAIVEARSSSNITYGGIDSASGSVVAEQVNGDRVRFNVSNVVLKAGQFNSGAVTFNGVIVVSILI